MPEYIDKDTLIEDAKTWFVTPDNSPLYDDIMRMVRNRVKLIPAADVRENVKATWICAETGQEDYEQYWVCSGCGEHNFYQARFCPDCGAQMGGAEDG